MSIIEFVGTTAVPKFDHGWGRFLRPDGAGFTLTEKKKIENAVGAFVARRRPPVHIRKEVDLDFRIAGQSIEIFEIRPVWQGHGETHEIPIAKATFVRTRGVWQLYWQRRDLKWHSYEPLPSVRSIEDVIAEIDADPYACFWG